jgi:hypothetical protein
MDQGDRADAPPVSQKSFKDRMCNLPWCAIVLVCATITAHSLVLIGNMATAQSFAYMGDSVEGWGNVGLSLSHSLKSELAPDLGKVNDGLTAALGLALVIEQEINLALGISGNSTEDALQQMLGDNPVGPSEQEIRKATHGAISALMFDLNRKIEEFWEILKPALEKIGEFLLTMGTKMQDFIEQFGTTIDKAQKLFDQFMAGLSGAEDVREDVVYHSFNIFDIRSQEGISKNDIINVSNLYGIDALVGEKGQQLHKKYDSNRNGELDMEEYGMFIDDPDVPGVATYVLRKFSKSLSKIAGEMKGGKMRDEVASSVSDYFEQMMAKNLTKVQWVSMALVNKSLPLEFTADVLRDLVLNFRAPDKLTDLPVGETVVYYMVQFDDKYLHKVIDQMADPEFWVDQGWLPTNQPIVLEQVNEWVASAEQRNAENPMDGLESSSHGRGSSLLESDSNLDANATAEKRARLKAMVASLANLTSKTALKKRMQLHRHKLRQEKIVHHKRIFHSTATRHLYRLLLSQSGAESVVGSSGDPDIDRVTKGGIPAAKETLQFAEWLSNNATQTSVDFNNYSFQFDKTSSNSIDSFANGIQDLLKKIQQFMNLMMEYSTKRGIRELQKSINDFLKNAEADLHKAVDEVLDESFNAYSKSTNGYSMVGRNKKLELSMLQLRDRTEIDMSGVWNVILSVTKGLKTVLPTVIDDITFAKNEVTSVAATMKDIFGTVKESGPPIFDQVSNLYTMVFQMYAALFIVIALLTLFYAFWAQGYMATISGEKEEKDRSCCTGGIVQRCSNCCSNCLYAMRYIQDGHICFWSCIILSEVIVLVMFVMAIIFSVLAGLKAFVGQSCGQIYILGDPGVCSNIITGLQNWLSTFWQHMGSSIQDACVEDKLTLCNEITHKMGQVVSFSVIGSFVAAILSIQLIFLTSILHERAVWANKVRAVNDD